MMKKLIVCMLLVCLALVIVACGETATTTQNGAVTTTPTVMTTTPAVMTAPETIPITVAPTVTTPAPETTATVNEASPLDAILENKTKLTFGDDGEFRVMCLGDLHLRNGQTDSVLKNLKIMVEKENPDLVILLGDIVTDRTIPNKQIFKSVVSKVVNYLEEKGIYWMHVFGNHDCENAVSIANQQAAYESYEYCLSKAGDADLHGVGNYVVPIYGADGTVKFALWGMDSGNYMTADEVAELFPMKQSSFPGFTTLNKTQYDYVHYDQIEWYLQVSRMLQEANNGNLVPGLMSMHIPLQEIYTGWINRQGLEWTGSKNEEVSAGCYNSGFFEAMRYRGDIQSVVFGHDHDNDYMVKVGGIKLCFSSTISSLGYAHYPEMMGSRVYVIKESDPANLKTYMSYLSEATKLDPDSYEALSGVVSDFEDENLEIVKRGYDNGTTDTNTISLAIAKGKGVDGSNALAITRTAWYTSNPQNNMEFLWGLEKPGLVGNNKYLVVWLDLKTNNVDFRKATFGVFADSLTTTPYRTDDYDVSVPFYYKADGTSEWVTIKTGADACFGAGDNSSVKGYKGWFAFPLEYMVRLGTKTALKSDTVITGLYFYMSCASQSDINKPVYIDNIMLVEDYKQLP